MKKLVLFLILLLIPLNVFALSLPDLYSNNVLIYDLENDEVLLEKNSNEKVSIASLTKIMTTITAIENISDVNEEITLTSMMINSVPWYASKAGLKVGDVVTYKDLLYASIIPSGADATYSLAISISGSVEDFVSKMNDLASKLELKDTHFVNVTGLDEEGHYSSANDILIMLKYALNNELFKEIYTTKEYTLKNGLEVKTTIDKYNRTMGLDLSRIEGSKTGFTDEAGMCMSSLFTSKERNFITITLGAPYVQGNYYNIRDALTIINFVDNNYKDVVLSDEEDLIKILKVKNSKTTQYLVYPEHNVTKYLPIDYNPDDIKIEYIGKDELSYKDKLGDIIGTINYYYKDELVKKEDVIVNEEFKMDISKVLKSNWLWVLLALIVITFILLKIRRLLRRAIRKQRRKRIRH